MGVLDQFIKRIAHTVNQHGKQSSHPDSKKITDFNEFVQYYKSYMVPAGADIHINRDPNYKKAVQEYEAKYGKFPIFPDKNQIAIRQQLYTDMLRNQHKKYLENWKAPEKPVTNAQAASAVSALAAPAGFIPHPFPKIFSAIASTPDVIYDWAASIDEPSLRNHISTGLNHAEDAAKIVTPGFKYDDYLFKGLRILSNTDDAVSAFKVGGQFKFPKRKAMHTEEEMHRRDLRKNLVNNSRPDYIKKARIPNRIKKGENGLKFNEFKAVQPTNRFMSESTITNPDLKINTDQYSDFANYKSIDQIQQELKQKRETAIQVPEIDYSSMSLEQLIEQENLPIKIVSSHRPGSVTKSGNTSHHSKLDEYGNSRAYDIQPMFNGKIDKSDIGFKRLTDIIMNNANARKWFQSHGFGILDETNASMMERTGATGKHFHIGPDKIALSGWNDLLRKYNLV